MFNILLLLIFICSSVGWASESTEWKEIGVIEWRLNNGMRVLFKPMKGEGEVHVALSALGGYTSLPVSKIANGILASEIVWESGLGTMNGDQLSVLFYDNSLEYALTLDPFWRGIEGVATVDTLPILLKVTNLIFTRPRFDEEIYKRVLKLSQNSAAKREENHERAFEELFVSLNSQNYFGLKSLQTSQLKQLSLDYVQNFFSDAFSNPADFTLVLAGEFKIEDVKPMIESYMGNISAKPHAKAFKTPSLNPFPRGVTSKVVSTQRNVNTTKLAFPIKVTILPDTIQKMDQWCRIIEGRLRKALLKSTHGSRGIDVSYEFPYYPYLDHPWLTIQYQGDFCQVCNINELIFKELKQLTLSGCTKEEVSKTAQAQADLTRQWSLKAEYWSSLLSNNSLWGWNPDSRSKPSLGLDMSASPWAKDFSAFFSFDQYTQLSNQSQNGK